MQEEKYNQIVKEFLDISARTTSIAYEMKAGDSVREQHLSPEDLEKEKEIKERLFKVLPEMDSKQLIKLLSQTKDFGVIVEIEKELVRK